MQKFYCPEKKSNKMFFVKAKEMGIVKKNR